MNEVYVVYGNTYFYGYGEYINLFGVFDTLDAAEKAFDKTRQSYFEYEKLISTLYEELEDPHTNVEKIEDIDFQIKKVKLNEIIDERLGGYAE